MDRKQKIQEIRASEKEFLQRVQELIETKHKPYLFEKYNETIATVAECYKDPQSSFAQKQACAEAATQKYLYREKRFEELMKYYQVASFWWGNGDKFVY